jgi:hypothetical protein
LIKVVLYKSSSTAYDITGLVSSITWSGDIDTLFRKVDISFKNTNDGKKVNFNYDLGSLVMVYDSGTEIFRGYVFTRDIDSKGEDSLVAYDQLIYAGKNNVSVLVKNKMASDIIKSEFRKFGIPLGSIESTKYKIPKKVFQSETLGEMVKQLLEETRKSTGKRYVLGTKKGKVFLKSREQSTLLTIRVDDIISGSKSFSIEDLKNQVLVYKGSLEGGKDTKKYEEYVSKSSSSINKYGVMQHVESVDDDTSYNSMKNKSRQLLKEMNKVDETISIEFLGDSSCITGNIVDITNVMTGIKGRYYITSDSHSFSDGIHKMTLQLSKRLE